MAPRFEAQPGLRFPSRSDGGPSSGAPLAEYALSGARPTLTFGWDRPTPSLPPPGWASLTLGAAALRQVEERRQPVALFTLADAASATPLRLRRHVIKGDGRCMFRALAQGMARNKGAVLKPDTEETEADQLRLAVAEALCRTTKRRSDFKDAVRAMEAEGDTIPRYCEKLQSPAFWGGEPEMLVLSKMLKVPIVVYLPEEEMNKGTGYIPIQRYGEQYSKAGKDHKARKPVRILFCGGNHYDLLLRQ